ncbi:MAG: hypothetical protein EZS28_026955 [Streblomastix strix]|uniref:Uncharacterized protein n=1 Tax=Streblomastix strix TaxID=222440 RepID=A0A5J4V5E5_9EUKA|nr:MAG: hypothetical protein EZS28_026955 [Streblomastix strix]
MTVDLTHEEIKQCGILFKKYQNIIDPNKISIWDAHKPLKELGLFPSSRVLTSNDIFVLCSEIEEVTTNFNSFLQLVQKAKVLSLKPMDDPFPEEAFAALAKNPSLGGKVPLDLIRQMLADYSFSIDSHFAKYPPKEWCISLEEFENFLKLAAKPMSNLDTS